MCNCKDIEKLCVACKLPCCLISQECGQMYSGLDGIDFTSIRLAVLTAHKKVKECFPVCFDKICKATKDDALDPWMEEVLDSEEFKCFIGLEIRTHWQCFDAQGSPTKCGFIVPQGDQYADYETIKPNDNRAIVNIYKGMAKEAKQKFCEWLFQS